MRISVPLFHLGADPDPRYQIKAQNLEKARKSTYVLYILPCHLQIDADPDPAYHFDLDPDPTFKLDADPDLQHCSETNAKPSLHNLLRLDYHLPRRAGV
jgi:hypothetical protein